MSTATNSITEIKREEISLQIGRAFDSLVVKANKAHLPEVVFQQHFLPFFAGELDTPALKDRDVITDWISIAGTPMSEVDIVDEAGATLFTVPPIFDSNIIEHVNRKAGNSLRDIMAEYEIRKTGIPAQANNFLNAALAEKSREMTSDTRHLSVTTARWNEIMKRYNKDSVDGTGASTKDTAIDPGDDVVYD